MDAEMVSWGERSVICDLRPGVKLSLKGKSGWQWILALQHVVSA